MVRILKSMLAYIGKWRMSLVLMCLEELGLGKVNIFAYNVIYAVILLSL